MRNMFVSIVSLTLLCANLWAQQHVRPVMGSVNGEVNVMDYGATCNGSTDDTAAIQRAINTAFLSANPVSLVIPATGSACLVSQLNLTNQFGAQTNTSGSIHITGKAGDFGQQSTIECNEASSNSGVCMDLSGSDWVTIDHLMITNGAKPPQVTLLLARTARDLSFSQGFELHDVSIRFKGSYAFYSYGGEIIKCINCNFAYVGKASRSGGVGKSAIVLSSSNSAGISSPNTILKTGWVSMSQSDFDSGSVISCQNLSGPCVELDNALGMVHSNTFDGYYNLGVGATATTQAMIADTGSGELHDIQLGPVKFRVETTGNSADQLVRFRSASIKGLVIIGTFVNGDTPTKPEISFTDASGNVGEGSIINLQPGDTQPEYTGGAGTVNTSGRAVTWVSGTRFAPYMVGYIFYIARLGYSIFSVNSATSITLTSSAGTQAGANYNITTPIVSCAGRVNGLVIFDRAAYGGGSTPQACTGAIEIPATSGTYSVDGNGNIKSGASISAVTLNQAAPNDYAGKCSMSRGTTCTAPVSSSYSSYICVAGIDPASAVPSKANVAKCSLSGGTVTVTAGISNSLTWDFILVGNPK